MPKVSVILPVYNAELYIERAIFSLMEQSLDDIECIIIDDGSKDNSLLIIEKILSKFPDRKDQVILLSRENKGVAFTRNEGLSLATGDYLIHLDSDDWVDLDWLDIMYKKAVEVNADVVICSYKEIYKSKNINIIQNSASTGYECIKKLLVGEISNSNWNKLVRRDIYIRNNIKYINGLNMGEDLMISFEIFMNSKFVTSVDNFLYYYNRVNDKSLTKKLDNNALVSISKVAEKILNIIPQRYEMDDDLKVCIDIFKNGIRNTYILNSIGDCNIKKRALMMYSESNYLINKRHAPKALIYAYYLNKIGLPFLWGTLDFILRVKREIN